jgi:hypothetical protein
VGNDREREGLNESEEFLHRHSGVADEGAKRADGELLVLRNREVYAKARLSHYDVAPHLADALPSGLLECCGCVFAGDVG